MYLLKKSISNGKTMNIISTAATTPAINFKFVEATIGFVGCDAEVEECGVRLLFRITNLVNGATVYSTV